MNENVSLRASLHHAASGASLEVPPGWQVVEDVGAVACEGPAGRADVTGRVVAARISIELVERQGLVPLRPLDVVVRDLVADALSDHPHAWLLDCVPWTARWDDASSSRPAPEGVRVDLAHHDMSTPLVVSTVLVALGTGLLRVTASLPVAHQRALGAVVDEALDSLRVAPGAPDLDTTSAVATPSLVKELHVGATASGTARAMAHAPLAYSAPRTWMTAEALEVFVAGSHKIAARWRPEPFAAGLVDERGVATPLGGFVRRAVSRPDARAALSVSPVELVQQHERGGAEVVATMTVDRLDGYAVLRATAPPVRSTTTPVLGQDHVSLEIVDVAAAPARAAAWLGVGPGRAAELPDGTLAVLGTARSSAPGTPAEHAGVIVSALPGPREVWVRLLDALA